MEATALVLGSDKSEMRITTGDDLKVVIGEKVGALADLKPGMIVAVRQMEDGKMDVRVIAERAPARTREVAADVRDAARNGDGGRREGDGRAVVERGGDRGGDAKVGERGVGDRGAAVRDIELKAGEKAAPGKLLSVEGAGLSISAGGDEKPVVVAVDEATVVMVDGQKGTLADLEPGMMVQVVQKDGATVRIEARRAGRR